jgi:hypothetical protein
VLQEGEFIVLQGGEFFVLQEGEFIVLQEGEFFVLQEGEFIVLQGGEFFVLQEGEFIVLQGGEFFVLQEDAFFVPLQEMGHRYIDLLKIDTEGFDASVLQGAAEALREQRIGVIVFEYHILGLWGRAKLHRVVRWDGFMIITTIIIIINIIITTITLMFDAVRT